MLLPFHEAVCFFAVNAKNEKINATEILIKKGYNDDDSKDLH